LGYLSTKVAFKNKVEQIMTLPFIKLFLDETILRVTAEPTGWAASSPMPHNYSDAAKGSISNPNLHDQLFFRTPLIANPRRLGLTNTQIIRQFCPPLPFFGAINTTGQA
jgi:hypothetical protein